MTALTDAGVALPTGWLWEDGGTNSRTTYANLFAAVTATLTATSLSAQAASRARSPALSAKASKAVEGAGIPTSTTVVSITSTTDRHFPERGVIAHLCANLEIRAHRDARPIVLVDLSKDCHLVVDRLLIFCWPFCAQFEGGTPTAPENYLDLSYYQKALAGL